VMEVASLGLAVGTSGALRSFSGFTGGVGTAVVGVWVWACFLGRFTLGDL